MARGFGQGNKQRKDHYRLGLKSVYIFASRQGLLFLLLLITTFITGTNYANNLILGLFFYLLSMWLVSAILTFLQLASLEISLEELSLAPVGGQVWATLAIQSHSSKASRQIHLKFLDSKTDKYGHNADDFTVLPSVKERILVKLPIQANKRGEISLPRLMIKSSYPLGVVQAWSYGAFASKAIVYPAPKACELPSKTNVGDDASGGDKVRMGQDDFERLDSYNEGESLARVSWSHMARGMGMLTKQFVDAVNINQVLDYYALAGEHEERLSALSYLVQNQPKGVSFRLILPSGAGAFGSGSAFVKACLIRLAKEP